MLGIVLSGLKAGKQHFSWHLGKEFFESCDNSEILDADLFVEAAAEKSGDYTGIDCSIRGTLTVQCDRCLDDLQMPVDETVLLSVKFGREDASSDAPGEGDGREVVYISPDESEFDLSQTVYDFALLSLPLHRVHPEGGCNPEVLKHLSKEAAVGQAPADSPFAALKGLLDKK